MPQTPIRCPYCTSGHEVRWIRIQASGQLVCVCPDCEMMWLRQDDVGVVPPLSLSHYLVEHGLPDDWMGLRRLGPVTRSMVS